MPPVYLVPFPGKSDKLRTELNELGVVFEEDGIFFKAQNSPLIQVCTNKGLCRIQDKASALSMLDLPITAGSKVWDCCSGAGGKALLLRQVYPETELFCSDKRKNILDNLQQRFALAGMPAPHVSAVDLSENIDQLTFPGFSIRSPYFDVVIADVPCSGSGTWRHNPEQAHFFDPDNLLKIQSLQKQIIRHAVSFLKPQGLLVYVTCSVFEFENEEMSDWCISELGLDRGFQGYLGRKAENADYMFRAVFRKKAGSNGVISPADQD